MFSGAYTALVTPFNRDGSVDFAKFSDLIARQAEAGIVGIVPCGTTGESPTLNSDEHCRVIDAAVEAAAGRMQVIAGSGSNATAEAVTLTRHAMQAGADATLQVTPYYNKPSQEGLYRHFSDVAAVGLPVVLYNVPGRSSREIAIDTIARLSRVPNIVCVKEAGGSVDRVSAILSQCDICVLSGDDALTLPMMAVGASGVISVASNLIPETVVALTRLVLAGEWEEARALHRKYYPLFCDCFLDTNPIPIKAAMAMAGLMAESYRLPLCSMDENLKERLRQSLANAGVDLV
ncbi:MAG: 4-hydroxy-tetrahydrodipicolinate synthase [Verrucomicrobia bacterium]|jgi:4-hydroxy-tetrahydrodipicolinate synthase|nr:4-hydroxy-tetrahydrodipicolinate synthase [Verrucomicrobiota bacterium]MBT7064768.1 4-hydroxy-tetrahydrodipicolinate synthase [Verrucomicrobiota bacterium]MBT7700975.1 4-hydroxy-tetrahydrodipicolinate synthase [Verrucomicrobiota bacterium]